MAKNIEIKKRARNSMVKAAGWVEEQNTTDSGSRWLQKAIAELTSVAISNVKQTICKDPKLAKFQYRCFTYNDKWIVAYKIKGNQFVVYRFIYGPWLNY